MGWVASLLPHRVARVPIDGVEERRRHGGVCPLAAQLYVAVVILVGRAARWRRPFRSYTRSQSCLSWLLVFACLTSAWKVNLPIPVANGSTLSVSYAANLMSLLLLGPHHAVLIAVAGVVMQCTHRTKHADPLYRAVFSTCGRGDHDDGNRRRLRLAGTAFAATGTSCRGLAKPLVGTIATYFLVNTSLVAGAIATSTSADSSAHGADDFLWSGASFMVAGTAGALSAVIVARGEHWQTILLVAPIYSDLPYLRAVRRTARGSETAYE